MYFETKEYVDSFYNFDQANILNMLGIIILNILWAFIGIAICLKFGKRPCPYQGNRNSLKNWKKYHSGFFG
jgi:hypothetical protein